MTSGVMGIYTQLWKNLKTNLRDDKLELRISCLRSMKNKGNSVIQDNYVNYRCILRGEGGYGDLSLLYPIRSNPMSCVASKYSWKVGSR